MTMQKVNTLNTVEKIKTAPFSNINPGSDTRIIDASIVKGHVNKLMLVFKDSMRLMRFVRQSRISVKYQGKKVHHLINRLPISHLIDISDMEHGSTVNADEELYDLMNSMFAYDINATNGIISLIEKKDCTLFIELGSVYLDKGSHIDIEIEQYCDFTVGSNVTGFQHLEVYSISSDYTSPIMFQYDTDKDHNEMHRKATDVYVVNNNKSQWFKLTEANDFSVISDSDVSYIEVSKEGGQNLTGLMGRFEGHLPSIIKIHDSEFPIDVRTRITGDNTDDVITLAVRLLLIEEKSMLDQYTLLNKKADVLKAFEQSHPILANYVQSVNDVPTSLDFRTFAQSFKS